jgi:sarcosine oxidase delta subunit
MGVFADLAFCGTKHLLSHVYQPKGLSHTARSANGMKAHLDTWSGYLFHRDPNLLQIINWSSRFFKFTGNLKFYLVSKDLVYGDFKKILWRSRHIVLSKYKEFVRLNEWYNLSIGEFFLIGTKQDVQNTYLRRVGPNFHSQSMYSKGSGNFVSEKLEINPKTSLFGNEIIILDHKFCEISKLIKDKFNQETTLEVFWLKKLRLISKAEYNYSKSVIRILLDRK